MYSMELMRMEDDGDDDMPRLDSPVHPHRVILDVARSGDYICTYILGKLQNSHRSNKYAIGKYSNLLAFY